MHNSCKLFSQVIFLQNLTRSNYVNICCSKKLFKYKKSCFVNNFENENCPKILFKFSLKI